MRPRGLYVLICVLVVVAAIVDTAAGDENMAEREALESYLGLVSEKVKGSVRYPWRAVQMGASGRVVLRFMVRADGYVLSPQVVESEGDDSFRVAALEAVRLAGQMPPFPAAIQRHTLLVELPLTYRLGAQSRSTPHSIDIGAADPRHAEPEEVVRGEGWVCYAENDERKVEPALVLVYVVSNRGEVFASVKAAGVEHSASFKVAGIHRRWDFGYDESEDAYLYAFVIKANGTGLYYDFSFSTRDRVRASDVFACERSKASPIR